MSGRFDMQFLLPPLAVVTEIFLDQSLLQSRCNYPLRCSDTEVLAIEALVETGLVDTVDLLTRFDVLSNRYSCLRLVCLRQPHCEGEHRCSDVLNDFCLVEDWTMFLEVNRRRTPYCCHSAVLLFGEDDLCEERQCLENLLITDSRSVRLQRWCRDKDSDLFVLEKDTFRAVVPSAFEPSFPFVSRFSWALLDDVKGCTDGLVASLLKQERDRQAEKLIECAPVSC